MTLSVTTTVENKPAYRIWTHQTTIDTAAVTVIVNEETGQCQVMAQSADVIFSFPISTIAGVQQVIDALAAAYPNGALPA